MSNSTSTIKNQCVSTGAENYIQRPRPPHDWAAVKAFRLPAHNGGWSLVSAHSAYSTTVQPASAGKQPTTEKVNGVPQSWILGHSVEHLMRETVNTDNTGIVLGGEHCIVALDIDPPKDATDEERLAFTKSVLNVLRSDPLWPVIKDGLWRTRDDGSLALVLRTDRPMTKLKLVGERGNAELLGQGQQLLCDGYHPKSLQGEPVRWKWQHNRSPAMVPVQDVPVVPVEAVEVLLRRIAESGALGECRMSGGAADSRPTAEIIQLPGTPPAGMRQSLLNTAAQNLSPDLSGGWFERLTPEQKNELLEEIAAHPEIVKLADADRATWFKPFMAFAHAGHLGADRAEDIARRWSQTSGKYDEAGFNRDWRSFNPHKPGGITIGTLLTVAEKAGIDLTRLRDAANTTVVAQLAAKDAVQAAMPVQAITALPGVTDPADALAIMNSMFFYAHDWGGEPLIVHCRRDGVRALAEQQFRSMLNNKYVRVPRRDAAGNQVGAELVPLGKWWLANPERREVDRVIYDPEEKLGRAGEKVFNLWTGLARTPQKRRWLHMPRHLFEVVCARDPKAFRYLVHWMAHAVQHPGTAPGVVIVLRSDREGTGKSTVLDWLRVIFGDHALMLSTPDGLLGEFNAHLENKSLICLNEPAFPGDHQKAGKLKSMITEPTWLINAKFRQAHQVPNIAHIAITTNAGWAVPAGNQARRFLVLDVSEHRAGDRAYFDALWHEAEHGGIEAMLHALMKVDLSKFDLRNVPRTDGLRQQQLLSASTMVRWAMDAVNDGAIVSGQSGGFGSKLAGHVMYAAYGAWCDGMRQRPVSSREFGRWLNRCNFARTMVQGVPTYDIPDAAAFEAAVMQQGGIT